MHTILPSQLALLALLGILVAALPLAMVWSARGQDRLRRLAWLALFLTFDLVVFGGFTRLTDAGLGCPDWPGCFSQSNPQSAAGAIQAAERLLPSGPVTMTKAWIEMIHRLLAMALGVIIATMALVSWLQRHRPGRSPVVALLAFALVCVQGAFGALTVTARLQPAIVTTHLLLGLTLLALLAWHALSFERADGADRAPSRGMHRLAVIASLALAVQIALGGWVSTNYAVLACSDFPLCQGQWLPALDLRDGFTLWRELGKTASDQYLPFEALTAIHYVHRSFAWVAALLLGVLALRAWRAPGLSLLARWLAALLTLQFFTGIATVLLGWPLFAAVLHNAGAAGLVLTMAMVNYRLGTPREVAPRASGPFRKRLLSPNA